MSDAQVHPGERTQVVLDTSVLLNFLRVGRLDLLVGLPGLVFLLTDLVRGEVTEPTHAAVLGEAIHGGLLREVRVDAADAVEAFARLVGLRVLGVGECAALAVAVCRGLPIAIDDKAARKKAVAVFGFEQFVGTADLVVAAIRGGLVDVADADRMKLRWELEFRFRLAFRSFADLASPQ